MAESITICIYDDPTLFDKAAELFETVISNNQYQLMNDYSKIFYPHSENNLETIFEIQRTTTSGWTNWGTSERSEGAFWENFAGPRSISNNHPMYYAGWGFMLPTKELYDYFLPDDTLRRNSAMLTPERLQEDAHSLDATVNVTWAISAYNSVDWEGQAQGKYLIWKDYSYIGTQALNNAGGEKLIRYSNVYLMLAECYLRGSNKDEVKAKNLIDEVRKAHVAQGSDTFDHVDDLLVKYPERFKTVMDVLWYERRVEFACEGDRWYDLVRSGRAKSIITKLLNRSYPNSQWNDHDIYLPLGSIEMGAAKESLSEYPDETYPYSTQDLSYTEEQ